MLLAHSAAHLDYAIYTFSFNTSSSIDGSNIVSAALILKYISVLSFLFVGQERSIRSDVRKRKCELTGLSSGICK